MRAKLVVVGGEAKSKEIELRLPAILGRGREATLALPHALVSRQHCEIFESNGQLVVRDLGSLNGTFVANERVTEAVLPHGDLLTVGTVTFRAVYLDSPADEDAMINDTHSAEAAEDTLPAPLPQPQANHPSQANPSQANPSQANPSQASPPQANPSQASPPQASPPQASPPQASPPPIALPVTPPPPQSAADNPAEEDDDLSSFFDSLQ